MKQDTARKRVVVVGASTGLGRCISIGLAAARRTRHAAGASPRDDPGRGAGGRQRRHRHPLRRDRPGRGQGRARRGGRGDGRHRHGDLCRRGRSDRPGVRCDPRAVDLDVLHQRRRRQQRQSGRTPPSQEVGRQRHLPVDHRRVVHGAVGRAERLPGDQGGAQPSRRALADRAARHQLHRGDHRRVRRRRGRCAVPFQRRLGPGADGSVRRRLVRPQPAERIVHRRRAPHRPTPLARHGRPVDPGAVDGDHPAPTDPRRHHRRARPTSARWRSNSTDPATRFARGRVPNEPGWLRRRRAGG